MLKCLLVDIPRVLFEPVAVIGALGFLYAFFRNFRNRGELFWIITGTVLFIIGWRLAFHSLMVSSRYASILLYPIVISAAWFTLRFGEDIRMTAQRIHFLRKCEKLGIVFTVLLFLVLCVWCIDKIRTYNPYADYAIKIGNALTEDAQGGHFEVCTTTDPSRIAYYAHCGLNDVQKLLFEDDEPWREPLKSKVHSLVNSFDPLYCVFTLNKNEETPTAESLGLTPEMGTWKILRREYTSRKKNREFVLARFSPGHPNIEEWSGPISGLPADNLVKNGDFEAVRKDDDWKKLLKNYTDLNIIPYMDPDRMIPANWNIDIGTWNLSNPPDLHLSNENVLAGRYSFVADSSYTPFPSSFYCESIPKTTEDGFYSFFVRNDCGKRSLVKVFVRTWLPDEGHHILDELVLYLDPGKIYRIHGVVPAKKFPQGAGSFNFRILAYGRYTFDCFSVTHRSAFQ